MRQLRERRTAGHQDHSFDARHIQGPLPQFRAKVVTEHLRSWSTKESWKIQPALTSGAS
jgi:hypothetical protein